MHPQLYQSRESAPADGPYLDGGPRPCAVECDGAVHSSRPRQWQVSR